MLDIQNGIRSLTDFKKNSSEVLTHIKQTHTPAILTVNGKAEAVLLDPASYQEMLQKAEYFDSSKRIRKALSEMEDREGLPAEEVFKGLKEKFSVTV
ncbi:MAG: type II toxin-antitoxin system Phd/YefM family antitoxin [Alphaproteobacteria bacterium]